MDPREKCSDPPMAVRRRLMRRAIALSRRGEGWVEPNPMVGCVIARGERIIGEGYHRRFGRPHAEVEALTACTENPRGATAYVSLEPCRHHGKTPPCTEALIRAGIARVVIAALDPLTEVSGGGRRQLRAAGIAVDMGLCAAEAADVLAPFLVRVQLRRPYVIAKWAQSLDGKLATRTGHSRWISCEASRNRVHRLRARVDAVLIGANTALVDNPLLTARGVRVKRQALRVVLDDKLCLPEKCQLVTSAGEHPTLIFSATARARSPKANRLIRKGLEIIPCRTRKGGLSLRACLSELYRRDVTNLLVEGGAAVLTSFLRDRLVDEAYVFVAPKIIGGHEAPAVCANAGATRVAQALSPQKVTTRQSGDDMLCHLRFPHGLHV
jgi:diaminohydroxyphosphoribosylaminopyrimidine deaminase/5-amino-6-(5-phosphoribosylamino)uracil reductase